MGSGDGGKKERGRGRLGDSNRQVKRDETFVSPWVKWIMFSSNMIFWFIGWGMIALGVWAYAYTEENFSEQTESQSVFDIVFDLSFIFISLGIVVFIIACIGALGALRENTVLLTIFAVCLGIIFLLEVAAVIAVFALSGTIVGLLQEILSDEAIIGYRDFINKQNIIDWFQEQFECCGVGTTGYKSWSMNRYFDCDSPSFEACSVPYSCCIPEKRSMLNESAINTRCGAGVLSKSTAEAAQTIFTQGCVNAVIETAKSNMLIIGGIAVAIVLPQLIGIFLARVLAGQINDQKERWRS